MGVVRPMIATPSPKTVARTPGLFAEKFLKIQNKRMQTIPLLHNFFQQDYLSKRSSRDLILKPRQLGFTTAIQGEFRRYEWTRASRTLTLGKDDENTTDLRAMTDFFYDNLPDSFRPYRAINNDSRTVYPNVKSRATIRKAGNTNSGRGGTNTHIHLSEAAFYPDAGKIVASALQAGTPLWVVAESTPNGARGWFYNECMAALRGESIWKLHFYRWFDNPDYAIPLEAKETLTYDDEEKELVRLHRLSPEQIKWRRLKKMEVRDLFPQEYPEDIKECFLQSGKGAFHFLPDTFTAPIGAVYNPTHQYVMGIDWGQNDDWTVAIVFDVTDYREVFIYRKNKASYLSMIDDIVKLAYNWHVDKIMPERNSMGTNIEVLSAELNKLEWPIDPRTKYPSNPTIQSFWMDIHSKDRLVKQTQLGIEAGLKLLALPEDDTNYIGHPVTIANQEIAAYISSQTPMGLWSYSHPPNEHDDTVDTRMLAHAATYELKA
jgi:hypothetical protein